MKKFLYIVMVASLLITGIQAEAAEPLKIGLMGPLTGSWASEGAEMKQVLDLLSESINAKGGILGRKVEILTQDDGGDPRTAALAAQRLSTLGTNIVIGTYGSAVTEASQNTFDENKIIQIANGSTAIRLTEKGLKFFFRTCPRDDEQAKVAAQAIRKVGGKKLAILHDNSTYAKGLAEETRGLLKDDKNVQIVFFDALTPKEQDYTAVLTKMKSVQPDMVFFTGYYGEAGLLLKQKKQMNWNVTFIGGDATNNPDLVKLAGKEAAADFYFVSAPLPKDLPSEQAKTFLADFSKKYGHPPNSIYAVLAGDGFRVAAHAMEQTKSTDSSKVADYLHKELKDFPGLTGKISFNEKGDRIGEVYRIYKVSKEGEFLLQQ